MPTLIDTVREIALRQPSSMRVFEELGIDYCCGGRKPLALACTEKDLDLDAVLEALAAAAEHSTEGTDWSKASLRELSEHIVSQHHEYVKRELPRLATLAGKVVAKHGPHHPELAGMKSAQQALDDDLTQHLSKEEQILFPYIGQLEDALAKGEDLPHGCFGTVAAPIAMMTQEHDAAGALIAELRRLSNDLTVPEDACPTYHAWFTGLKEFEQDLHQHIHLENNILFPRAIELETTNAR
jgi:regulator of cell morphogenesis and NO signaling